jgi:hypothetical protein
VTSLAAAVEQRRWRLVSLYLLLGVSEAASRLPPETLTELLDLLGGAPDAEAPYRETGGRRRG